MNTSTAALRALVREGEIHSSVYSEPEIFQLEMDRLFHSRWLFLGHTSQLDKAGAFITGRIGSVPVACVKGKDGDIKTFINRCPHRGAQVCQGSAGYAPVLVCPYHGWSFDLDGKLNWIPLREEYAGSACDRLRDLEQVGATDLY